LESLKAVESVVDLCNLGEGFFGEHNRLVLGIGECLGRSVEHQVRSIISLKVLAAIARSYKLLRSIYRRWRIEPNSGWRFPTASAEAQQHSGHEAAEDHPISKH
jgi:hypothetical protein